MSIVQNWKNSDPEIERAWLGGFVSTFGTFYYIPSGNGGVGYRVSSSRVHEAIETAAVLASASVAMMKRPGDKEATHFSLSGETLHEVMTKIWPYLTSDRKREYARLRKQLRR